MYRLTLAKEDFKFAAAHLTLLNAHEAERLHGHNYQVRVYVTCRALDDLEFSFEFNTLKRKIRSLIAAWDERVLLPTQSPHFVLQASDQGLQVTLRLDAAPADPSLDISSSARSADGHGGKEPIYVFPASDVIQLPVRNVTSESLARLLTLRLAEMWKMDAPADLVSRVLELEVHVEETRGQSAGFVLTEPLGPSKQDSVTQAQR